MFEKKIEIPHNFVLKEKKVGYVQNESAFNVQLLSVLMTVEVYCVVAVYHGMTLVYVGLVLSHVVYVVYVVCLLTFVNPLTKTITALNRSLKPLYVLLCMLGVNVN